MKKVLSILFIGILCLSFLPLTKSFAYDGGLLDVKPLKAGADLDDSITNSTRSVTDNDLESYFSFPSSWKLFYKFSNPVTIDRYFSESVPANYIRINFYDAEMVLIKSIVPNTTYGFTDISPVSNVTYVSLNNISAYSVNVKEFDVYTSNSTPSISYDNVSNVLTSLDETSVTLSWDNPDNEHFTGIEVYKNGSLAKTLDKTVTTTTISNLTPGTSYTFDIYALYDDGQKSTKVSKTVTTEEIPQEPLKLKSVDAEPKYNRVDLSWVLPENDEFKHVNIYRDTVEDQTALSKFFGQKTYAAATTKIFETNGTYFNDLTVEPDTKYDYTLSITDTSGNETGATDLSVTTPKEPTPVIEGGSLEPQDNGDYLYTWDDPSTGEVKLMVGGKEYKTVPASDKQILIPKDDMKYTTFGDPDISVVPIGEFGAVGETQEAIEPMSQVSLPFGANELLKSGASLLWIVGPFVLLALAFLVVPKLRRILFSAFSKDKGKQKIVERRTGNPRVTNEPKERKSDKERIEKGEERAKKERERIVKEKPPKERKRKRVAKEPRIKERKSRQPSREPRANRERVRPVRATRESRK